MFFGDALRRPRHRGCTGLGKVLLCGPTKYRIGHIGRIGRIGTAAVASARRDTRARLLTRSNVLAAVCTIILAYFA